MHQIACHRNSADAMYALAKVFFTGRRGVQQDVPRAVALLERAVHEKKHPRSMVRLATLLRHGWTMPRDHIRALQLFEKASAESNNVEATFALATMLESGGEGVQPDKARAEQLYEKCLQQGGPARTMFKLAYGLTHGQFFVKNGARAVKFYEAAIASEEHTRSMFMLGRMLVYGTDGVTRDVPRALELFEQAANEKNHVKSMASLGMYFSQEDEPGKFKDLPKARLWLVKAARNGSESAVTKLGELLEYHGDKLLLSHPEAIKLFEASLEKNDSRAAKYYIAWLVSSGNGVPIDLPRAMKLYVAAMNAGYNRHGQAVYNLARIVELQPVGPKGVDANFLQASFLYERATVCWGHADSVIRQWELYKRGRSSIGDSSWDQRLAVLEEAVSLLDKVGAMYTLAEVLRAGPKGVAVDARRAEKMYECVIAEGTKAGVWRMRAMMALASLLETGGEDVPVDRVRALELYEMAAEEGEEEALFRVAQWAEYGGLGVKVDKKRASGLYERAVGKGHVGAMRCLARMLHYGAEGIEADRKGAIGMYLKIVREADRCDVETVVNLAMLVMENRGKRRRETDDKSVPRKSRRT